MIVLGIIDSKPSSAAILKDGMILSAIAEERLCRMKMARKVLPFPFLKRKTKYWF